MGSFAAIRHGAALTAGNPVGLLGLVVFLSSPSLVTFGGLVGLLFSFGWSYFNIYSAIISASAAKTTRGLAAKIARLMGEGVVLRQMPLASFPPGFTDSIEEHLSADIRVAVFACDGPAGSPSKTLHAWPIRFDEWVVLIPGRASPERCRLWFEVFHEFGHAVAYTESINTRYAFVRLLFSYAPVVPLTGFHPVVAATATAGLVVSWFLESADIGNEWAADLWALRTLRNLYNEEYALTAMSSLQETLSLAAADDLAATLRSKALLQIKNGDPKLLRSRLFDKNAPLMTFEVAFGPLTFLAKFIVALVAAYHYIPPITQLHIAAIITPFLVTSIVWRQSAQGHLGHAAALLRETLEITDGEWTPLKGKAKRIWTRSARC